MFAPPAQPVELTVVHSLALGLLAVGLGCALFAPPLFWLLLLAVTAAGVLFLAWRHLATATAIWLLVTAATLEMALSDLVGPRAFQPTIAIVKASGLLLAALAVLRYGLRLDLFNPSFAWLVMFFGGLAHGLWPELSAGDSLRSLIGSIAPFVFGFSRLSRRWAQTIIRTTAWAPLLCLAVAAMLAGAGLRPLFVESGGARLAGLSHPALLAAVCQAAVYASLIELYRTGRPTDLLLLGSNLLVLLLTGARAPLSCTLAVVGLSLLLVSSPAMPSRRRLLLILAGGALLPLFGLATSGLLPLDLQAVRAFRVLATDVGNLSGRLILWPKFEAAAAASPWVGWGIGAGSVIIPPDSPAARLLHTWAAHNEYLRVQVEGGQIGRALLIGLMVLWLRAHTAPLPAWERRILRLVFLGFAVHAYTDNLLISSPACVLFTFAIAVFARGRYDRQPTIAVTLADARAGGVGSARPYPE